MAVVDGHQALHALVRVERGIDCLQVLAASEASMAALRGTGSWQALATESGDNMTMPSG
jgi:hypothetical protein